MIASSAGIRVGPSPGLIRAGAAAGFTAYYRRLPKPRAADPRINGVKRWGHGSAIDTRALECALAAAAALLAADGIRATLGPFWTIMRMLFGI
jgi:hypothetical protein